MHVGITDSRDVSLSKLRETVKDREPGVLQPMGSWRVGHNWATEPRQTALYKWLVSSFVGPAVLEQLQSGRTNDTGSLVEPEQVVSSFSEASSTVGGLGLWRQQLCAVAKVRFLKLKSEKRALLAMWVPASFRFIWAVCCQQTQERRTAMKEVPATACGLFNTETRVSLAFHFLLERVVVGSLSPVLLWPRGQKPGSSVRGI